MRSVSPLRPNEEKDRVVRKLKAELLPLKQQENTLPLLQLTCQELIERLRAAQHEKISLDQEFRARIEASQRSIAELKTEYERLKSHQRTLLLSNKDLVADRNTLKAHRQKCDSELDKLRKDADALFSTSEQLILETNKLLHTVNTTTEENHILATKHHMISSQNAEITLKLAEVRSYVAEMTNDKQLFISQIRKYEDQNNNLEEVDGERETSIDMKTLDARKKDDAIRMQLDRLTELESRTKKIRAESAHKSGLLRMEQERGIEYQTHIRNAEKCVKDIQEQIGKESNHCRDIAAKNEQARDTNHQITRDMEHCEAHLENLLVQNEALNNELNRLAHEDDFIIKLIAARRTFRPLTEYVLKASRATVPGN